MSFSCILKELRQEKCLTHKELAEKVGFSKAIIGFWESGKYEPTGKALIALSIFFNVSTDFLLGLEQEDGTKTRIHKNEQ